MKSLKIFDRRLGSVGASIVMLLGILVPGLIPMAASAATLTARSVEMSSSAVGATSVTYQVSFATVTAAKGFVVDFCTESPFSGDDCTAPTGMVIPGTPTVAFSAGGIGTVTASSTGNEHVAIQGSTVQTSAGTTTFTIAGITNPSGTGVFYARVYTYTGTIDYTDANTPGTVEDEGGMALDATLAIGVTAAVREKLIFCVSGLEPGPSCGLSGQAVTTPSLTLGEGTPQALDSSVASTGNNFSQVSTNAVGGAVVNLKNSNSCGGLHRTSQSDPSICEIAPAGTSAASITGGTALFGLRLGAESGDSGSVTKTAAYSDATTTKYGMGWVTGNATGVSSTYGDQLYTTSGAPANNMNVPMTFAASISNDTPAGIYTATINLIASGTF